MLGRSFRPVRTCSRGKRDRFSSPEQATLRGDQENNAGREQTRTLKRYTCKLPSTVVAAGRGVPCAQRNSKYFGALFDDNVYRRPSLDSGRQLEGIPPTQQVPAVLGHFGWWFTHLCVGRPLAAPRLVTKWWKWVKHSKNQPVIQHIAGTSGRSEDPRHSVRGVPRIDYPSRGPEMDYPVL